MSLLEPYQEVLGVRSKEELVSLFLQTLSPTNRTYDFFVDWNKVQRHVQAVRVEIALLSSLAGAQDPARGAS
jgi:type II restriction enzyme